MKTFQFFASIVLAFSAIGASAAPASNTNESVVLLKNGIPVLTMTFAEGHMRPSVFQSSKTETYLKSCKDGVLEQGEVSTGVNVEVVRMHAGGYDVRTKETVLQGLRMDVTNQQKCVPQVPVMSGSEHTQHIMIGVGESKNLKLKMEDSDWSLRRDQ
jgi:hypothetical protein